MRFAVIGAGLTGTSFLCQLNEKLQHLRSGSGFDPTAFELQVFERQGVCGPGLPHNPHYVLPCHITNMCVEEMGVFHERPEDFRLWLDQQLVDPQIPSDVSRPSTRDIRGTDSRCQHHPRALMGSYLEARFTEAVTDLRRRGLRVRVHRNFEVTDLRDKGECVRISGKPAEHGRILSYRADRALLASGHWFGRDRGNGHFGSPWPAQRLLDGIPQGVDVAVLGSSLSAIETALTLTAEGRFESLGGGRLRYLPPANPRRLTLLSRGGQLPRIRGSRGGYRNRFLTRKNLRVLMRKNDGRLTLKSVFELLDAELSAAYSGPIDWAEVKTPRGTVAEFLRCSLDQAATGDSPSGEVLWQSILQPALPLARELYLALSATERSRFDREFSTLFFLHAATQPRINGEKLLALIEAGVVKVEKLSRDYRLREYARSGRYQFDFVDHHGRQRREAFAYLVDARGQRKSMSSDPSLLAQNLIRTGTVQLRSPLEDADGEDVQGIGSAWIDPQSHFLKRGSADGGRSHVSRIYAVGAMTRGQIIDTSMARGIARSTARVVDDLCLALSESG